MNILDTLKGAIFEEEPVSVAKEEVRPVAIAPRTSYGALSVGVETIPNNTTALQPAISPKRMRDTLLAELAKNTSGSPFAQFQKISSQMKQKIGDAATRCIASGSALEAQGITKAQVLESAKQSLAFLNNEAANFQAEIANNLINLEKDFTAKSTNIASLLEQKQNQIKALSEEISNLQKDRSALEVETQATKTKLEVSKIEFTGSLDSILQEINTDINDITVYLGV